MLKILSTKTFINGSGTEKDLRQSAITLVEKLFPNPAYRNLLAASIGYFILSIIAAAFSMFLVGWAIRDLEWRRRFKRASNYLSSLYSSVALFGFFFSKLGF